MAATLRSLLAQSEQNAATGTGDDKELLNAYIEIAKQLVSLSDQLPQLTQCIVDVNAGTYQPSDAAVIASGGKVTPIVDSATGQPVQILVKEEKIVDPAQTIAFTTDSNAKIEVSDASSSAPSDQTAPPQEPAPSTDNAEKPPTDSAPKDPATETTPAATETPANPPASESAATDAKTEAAPTTPPASDVITTPAVTVTDDKSGGILGFIGLGGLF